MLAFFCTCSHSFSVDSKPGQEYIYLPKKRIVLPVTISENTPETMPKKKTAMKVLLSGNEAIARGAYEAGVSVASAYPGTPSTEILENLAEYKDIYAEWAPNEKVALEVATGAAIAGARAMAAMKHVGVNVAADPLFTASYTGVRGGLVIISADDPDMHSSQNEQDNRNYAKFSKVPMLEPADSQEAKEFVRIAFELSEQFDTPVFIRMTTRTSHAKSVVTLEEPHTDARNFLGAHRKNGTGENGRASVLGAFLVHPQRSKFVMLPQNARNRHPFVEERLKKLGAFADTFERNEIDHAGHLLRYYHQRRFIPLCARKLPGLFVPEACHGIPPSN